MLGRIQLKMCCFMHTGVVPTRIPVLCVHTAATELRRGWRPSDNLELEWLSCELRVGISLRSSGVAAGALDCQALSPAPMSAFDAHDAHCFLGILTLRVL